MIENVCIFDLLCSEKEKLDDDDGDHINHEQAPTGDEYAVVDTSSKKKVVASENQAFYQVHVHCVHCMYRSTVTMFA